MLVLQMLPVQQPREMEYTLTKNRVSDDNKKFSEDEWLLYGFHLEQQARHKRKDRLGLIS